MRGESAGGRRVQQHAQHLVQGVPAQQLRGRTLLEPCMCKAGYELHGELCVACPAGKAREANDSNSIMCETCSPGTFASVSASITCGACSSICDKYCPEKVYDFPQVAIGPSQLWKDYAAAIGFLSQSMFWWGDGMGMGQWNNAAKIQRALPVGYDTLEVAFYATYDGEVCLQIDGVTKAKATMPCSQCPGFRSSTVLYTQQSSPGYNSVS